VEEFLTRIKEDFFVELVWIITGILLTSCAVIIRKINERGKRKKTFKQLSKLQPISEAELNIVSIGNAVPYYETINIEHSKKKFYLDFPEELKEQILSKVPKGIDPAKNPYIFQRDCSFNGGTDFQDIIQETGISNLKELIEKHRRKVAYDFLEKKNGCYFNGRKYGVYSIDGYGRVGENETPILELTVFDTDYFTHKVFRSIYEELKQQEAPITKASKDDLFKYRAFMTSLGLNVYVITDSPSGDMVLISRRSSSASETRGLKPYNSTVMEGLSQTDLDSQTMEISIKKTLHRALYEELGIPLNYHDKHESTVHFYDIFLERNYFEIGLTASIKLNMVYEQDIEPLVAKDKVLEIDEIIPTPFKEQSLNTFIKDHMFMNQGLYTLKMVAARRNITLKRDFIVVNNHKSSEPHTVTKAL
jgi:hypothetical protein